MKRETDPPTRDDRVSVDRIVFSAEKDLNAPPVAAWTDNPILPALRFGK